VPSYLLPIIYLASIIAPTSSILLRAALRSLLTVLGVGHRRLHGSHFLPFLVAESATFYVHSPHAHIWHSILSTAVSA
ncbi:hypothetical protein C8J57DRAFT_1306020, partial [Mycena rebaudengoi]